MPADRFKRYVTYPLQALGAALGFGLLRALPVDAASALGGWLGRRLGPRLGVARIARRNLERAFPDKSKAEIDTILAAMWDNLGRVAGEYPHLDSFQIGQRIELVGGEHIHALKDDGRPGIFFSAHLGNWEVAALAAVRLGLPVALIYRAAGNPLAEWVFTRGRGVISQELIPKGPSGARRALHLLKSGGHLAMLVDQKMNDGLAVPFFGRPAMTAPALAQMALRYDCPVVPAQVVRLKGARFRIIMHPPLTLPHSGDRQADVLALMTAINAMIEDWIRQNPAQWLWVHRRWKD